MHVSHPVIRTVLALVSVWIAFPLSVDAQGLPTLMPADYEKWESISGTNLSHSGDWIAVSLRRVDTSVEIQLRAADGSGEVMVLSDSRQPMFSPDGRWMAYRKGYAPDERDRRSEADESVRDRLGLVDLTGGVGSIPRDTVLWEVNTVSFRDDGRWLAASGFAASGDVGSDISIIRMDNLEVSLFGNVDQFAWEDEGDLLAMAIRTESGNGNGVTVLDPASGVLRTLESSQATYKALTWREDSSTLAVLRSTSHDEREGDSHDVLLWEGLDSRSPEPTVLAHLERTDLSDEFRILDSAGIQFSADGRTLFIGIRDWESTSDTTGTPESNDAADTLDAPAEDSIEDPENDLAPADVQVWHWDDDLIIRAQELSAARDGRASHLTAWHLDTDQVIQIGRDHTEPVRRVGSDRWGLEPDYEPYRFERRFGDRSADWYLVDLESGERSLLASGIEYGVQVDPMGDRALIFRDAGWDIIDLESRDIVRVVPEGETEFLQSIVDYDYPGSRPSWGMAGWSEDGESAFLNDKHDIWRVDIDSGRATRVTNGAEHGHQYRIAFPAGFVGDDGVDTGESIWLTVRNLTTKASGYARLDGDQVSDLLLEESRVLGLVKAEDSERFAFRKERWDDSPDVFVADFDLANPVQITATNSFQSDYAWGHSELVSYSTNAGHDLQAKLIYPAGFVEGRQYPLILYQYERLSDGLHNYSAPTRRDYYNPQVWSQNGYFVLMPDIIYEPGRPGPSALDAVEHALDAALATGHIDPDKMGLIGHSWGGYQAAYLPTRMNRFSASVAGAAITNFVSFMGAVHWSGGLPENGHWETGQARMAVPFWDDFEGHLESSPIHKIHELETPVLVMHGDDDGVVDFRQGLEYYNDARRAGKEVVMLVYPGAGHGLSDESQQADYQERILEWFGHYLKGEPAATWITDGESWQERAKRMGG